MYIYNVYVCTYRYICTSIYIYACITRMCTYIPYICMHAWRNTERYVSEYRCIDVHICVIAMCIAMQKVTWKHVVAKGEILRTELLDVLPHLVGLHTLGFRRVNGLEYTHAVQCKLLKLVQRDLILPRTRGVTLYSQQRQPIPEHTSCTLVYKATTHNRIYRRVPRANLHAHSCYACLAPTKTPTWGGLS